jgi:hypothetical protein
MRSLLRPRSARDDSLVGNEPAMAEPPLTIDGATVVRFADVRAIAPTGRTRHYVAGEPVTDFVGLAIGRYDDTVGFQLFYCDENWVTINDGYGATMEEVLRQVESGIGPY